MEIRMELFSELYGCYYQTVKKILTKAQKGITEKDMKKISEETAFIESSLYILPKLITGKWNLLIKKNELYYSKLKYPIPFYLTKLQKSFIKSILKDKRIHLFLTDSEIQQLHELLKEVEPLFYAKDFHYFDQFQYGDSYTNEQYIVFFKNIYKAINEKKLLDITYKNNSAIETFLPVYLEYSEKNDKFRLYAIRVIKEKLKHQVILNISSIKSLQLSEDLIVETKIEPKSLLETYTRWEKVTFLIFNERNALERCTLQFSSYKKQIKYKEAENCYQCTIYYDKADEKEILIRLLSFGPLIKVIEPDNFVGMMKKRILRQRNLLYHFKS